MNEHRFDELARALSTQGTRRGLLASLAAALGLTSRRGARAACPPEQVERRGLGCICTSNGRPPATPGGLCPCPNGQERCGAECMAPSRYRSDPFNCGRCGNVCPADVPFCARGACVECLSDLDCDDGIACTIDRCIDGFCHHTADHSACDDGNPCTTNTCDPATGCVTENLPESTPCPDDDYCNGAEVCNGHGLCLPGQPVECGPCQRCDNEVRGCTADPAQNGTVCGIGRTCADGACVCAGMTYECDGGCFACCEDAHCPDTSQPFCVDHACKACRGHDDCPDELPFCVNGSCHECRGDGDCPDDRPACIGGVCYECRESGHCPGDRPICHQRTCVQCTSNTNCSGSTPVCHQGRCVECTVETAQEVCEERMQVCVDNRCSCYGSGQSCTASWQCCQGHSCRDGVCCTLAGQPCVSEHQCCTGTFCREASSGFGKVCG